MKLFVMAMAASSVMAPHAAPAGETEKALQLRPKAAISTAVAQITPAQANAPFVAPAANDPELTLAAPLTAQESSRSSCSGERALCYDAVSGRVVYKPARQFMPDLPGLRPENISIKRRQLVFRYSF